MTLKQSAHTLSIPNERSGGTCPISYEGKLHSEDAVFIFFDGEDTYSADCHGAIASSVVDYGDAVMVQTTKRIGADCIVT